jgi:hypothetical protein
MRGNADCGILDLAQGPERQVPPTLAAAFRAAEIAHCIGPDPGVHLEVGKIEHWRQQWLLRM